MRRNLLKGGSLSDFLAPKTVRTGLISAHRGGGSYAGYPENCIESFAHLARQMPLIIETDIAQTKDSVLIMMHDDTYERTTTGTGAIAGELWHYGKKQYLKDHLGKKTNYRIPTLEDVLKWGRNRVIFALDIKKNVSFQSVVETVQRHKAWDYAMIITYNNNQAVLVHRLEPRLMLSVTIQSEEEYQRLHEAGIPDNRMVAFVGVREASDDLYDFLHVRGIATILGTLGNLDKMALSKGDYTYQKFVDNGADILSTDRPLEAGKILKLLK